MSKTGTDFNVLARPVVEATETIDKLVIVQDLGVIMAPRRYVHNTQIGTFLKKSGEDFEYIHPKFTDESFPSPSHIMSPGERFHVQIVGQVKPTEMMTCAPHVEFLREKEAVFLGAQGLTLVWAQNRRSLDPGYSYVSLDEEGRLPYDHTTQSSAVPRIAVPYYVIGGPQEKSKIRMSQFKSRTWMGDDLFLLFTKI